MIALRAYDEIDARRAAHDFCPLGLCDATSHRHDHATAALGLGRLQATDRAKLGIHLFGGFFPDVAGIEDNQVGVLRVLSRNKTMWPESVHHARRIVDIHLAAIGPDEDPHCDVVRCSLAECCLLHSAASCLTSGENGSRPPGLGGSGTGCGRPDSAAATPPAIRA